MPQQLIPFLLVVAVLTVTPGPDMALVLRNGVASGPRAAWLTGLGCCTGIAVHASAAVLGLSAILAASATAFTVVKLLGAGYLVYLGAKMLWSARRGVVAELPPARARAPYRQGLLCNLLNPKIALLFLTLLPQFVGAREPRLATSAELAAVFLVIAALWWSAFAVLVGVIGRALTRARVRQVLDGLTGAVLIGLGLRVAFEHA